MVKREHLGLWPALDSDAGGGGHVEAVALGQVPLQVGVRRSHPNKHLNTIITGGEGREREREREEGREGASKGEREGGREGGGEGV